MENLERWHGGLERGVPWSPDVGISRLSRLEFGLLGWVWKVGMGTWNAVVDSQAGASE